MAAPSFPMAAEPSRLVKGVVAANVGGFLAIALTASAASYITIASDGARIPYPTSTNTCAVTNNGKVIQVPEGMVYIPAGSFTYGTGTSATNITLDGYCIGKFSVTEAEYK